MKYSTKTIIALAAFVILMITAGIIYNSLSERYEVKNPLNTPVQEAPRKVDQEDGSNTGPDSAPAEEPKVEAPDFTALDGDGNEVRLHDYKGTPVVLNFWASWCGQCQSEIPIFDKVSQEYPEDELVFLMVDLVDGFRETMEKGKKYVEDKGFTFKVLYDTKQEAAYSYGVRYIPSTLFIDKDGYVLAGFEGPMGEEVLRLGIDLIVESE